MSSIVRGNDLLDSAKVVQRDASGNTGLGNVTPSAWTSLNVIEGSGGTFFGSNGISALTGSNAVYNGSWTYKGDGSAGLQLVNQGNHQFRVAGAGLAGGALTWTNVANIDATGINVASGTVAVPGYGFLSDTNTGISNPAADTLAISTGGSERIRVDANGNVGIGVTPSAWFGSGKHIQTLYSAFGESAAGYSDVQNNSYEYDNNAYKYIGTGLGASRYVANFGNHIWKIAPSGTAGNVIPWTDAMTLVNTGNLLVGTAVDNGYDKVQINGSVTSLTQLGSKIGHINKAYITSASPYTFANIAGNNPLLIEIYTPSSGITCIPIYPFGGSGVKYVWNVLNPSTGTFVNNMSTTSISFNIAEQGLLPNTYTLTINGSTGSISISAPSFLSYYYVNIRAI